LMTAHVVYPALDPRRPATLSPAIATRLLRRALGFRGVLFSDDLDMNAIAGRTTPGRSAVAALAAGRDMLLVCQSLSAARAAIDAVATALARRRIDAAAVAASLARLQALRALVRPGRGAERLRWPAHARLARRLAA